MPITKSAKKALRQTRRRTVRNLRRKEAYKRVLKQIQKLLAAGNIAEAQKLVPQAYKAIDKAAKTGVLEKNAAARHKSRLMNWIRKTKTAA
jgi:small subunit ribosomal protein S20